MSASSRLHACGVDAAWGGRPSWPARSPLRPWAPGSSSGPLTLSCEQAGWGKKYLPGFYSPFLNVRVAHIYLSVSKNLLTLKSEDPLCRAGRQRATPKTVLGGTSVSPKFTR